MVANPRVYVDELPQAGWGRWNGGAHMLANDLDALHDMAIRIGLKRSWFQDQASHAHYDLTKSKRALALQQGAIPIAFREIPEDVLMRCSDGSYELRSERMARIAKKKAIRR